MKPSLFNDVIGPVMRGPSSSHTAASWRIARVCLDILSEPLKRALVEFETQGSWATNYEEQGTAMGVNGGLLGLDITDARMKETKQLLEAKGISVNYAISTFQTRHVNTLRISLEGVHGTQIRVMAESTGGGSFAIYRIDDFEVDIRGDYFEWLLFQTSADPIPDGIRKILPEHIAVTQSSAGTRRLLQLRSSAGIPSEILHKLKQLMGIKELCAIKPILPVISGNETALPFSTIASLLAYAEMEDLDLGAIGLAYETCLSGLSESALSQKMKDIIRIVDQSLHKGLEGTSYKDRILHHQSHLIGKAETEGKILQNTTLNKTIAYVTAIMESKSAMEVFVANPTAGSCGTVGGVLKAIAEELDSSEAERVKAYFAAGMVGVYFAAGPGFSAEEHGCQVECGAASGMAAAAIVQLFGGTARQALDAASMAIQNMIGLICDPVADRVEVPCLGKNIHAALNAYASATMICAGFDAVIPLEEVLQSVTEVSSHMPACHKCSGTGGLAITKTARALKSTLGSEMVR